MARLLVIGASGKIGSATIRAALAQGIPTTAFLRTPSKLPGDLKVDSVKVVKGDATSPEAVGSAFTGSDPKDAISAVVLAAPFGSMRKRGATGYEEVLHNVLLQVMREQKSSGRKIKVWIMAGSAVLDHPVYKGRMLSGFMPVEFYVEYRLARDWLLENCTDVDWTMLCPAAIGEGKPVGPYYESTEVLPGYQPPYPILGWIPGWNAVNIFYNWIKGPVTFESLGQYMVDNLEADGRLKAKRVGVLEDPKATR